MELLERLEQRISDILAKLNDFKSENTHLRDTLSNMALEKSALEEENHKLHESLAQRDALREEAVKRIDTLLCRIEEHDSIE